MHERRPLESMSGSFASQKSFGEATQVFVNFRHHLANSGGSVAFGMIRLTHMMRTQRRSR
jgi:hypothetical protein